MKTLVLLLAMFGTAYAEKWPASGPCADIEACEKACAKNAKGTCYWAAVLVLQSAEEGRWARAQKLFEKPCGRGDAEACFQAARAVENVEYEETKASGPKSLAAYKKGCDKNHARACESYGYLLDQSKDENVKKGAASIQKKAAELFSKRCFKQNMVNACGRAAYAYEEGSGVAKSKPTADKLRAHACKLDSAWCAQ